MPRKKSKLGPGKFVRFPRRVLHQIESIAIQEGRTVSGTVRVLVEQALVSREFGSKESAA